VFKSVFIAEKPIIQPVILENTNNIATKPRFKAVLQLLNVPGANGRKYPQSLVESQLRDLQPRMKNKDFLGELDHPISDDVVRNGTVLLQNVSHAILEAYIQDGKVYGIIEPLSTPNGQILHNLVIIDKVPVGFSLRAFGNVQQEQTCLLVTKMTMITYDAVSNPSFKDARIFEVTTEDVKRALEQQALSESSVLLEQKNPVICIGDKCYLLEFFDQLVEQEITKQIYKFLWGF